MDKQQKEFLLRLGQRIKALREEKNISVRKFAYAAGIDPTTLYRIESEGANPSLTTIMAIAKELDTDILTLTSRL